MLFGNPRAGDSCALEAGGLDQSRRMIIGRVAEHRTGIRQGERLRRIGRDVNVQRIGNETRTVVVNPNGQRVVTVTGPDGRLIRRSRYVNNREVVIIDNRPRHTSQSAPYPLAFHQPRS